MQLFQLKLSYEADEELPGLITVILVDLPIEGTKHGELGGSEIGFGGPGVTHLCMR